MLEELKMDEIIEKIKLNGFIIENTCDFETMAEAYEAVMTAVDEAEETGIYTSVEMSKADERGGYSYLIQVGHILFVIVRNACGYGFIFFDETSEKIKAEYNSILEEMEYTFHMDFGNMFDNCIFSYLKECREENKETWEVITYIKQRIINTFNMMDKAEFKAYCMESIANTLDVEIDGEYDRFFNIGWNDINPVNIDELSILYNVLKYHIMQVELTSYGG